VDTDSTRVTDQLVERALTAGASDAALLRPEQVVTADWVRWKCLYGCPVAGRCLTCPPHSPTPQETRSLLDAYQTVLLLRFDVAPERAEWLKSAPWVLRTALALEQDLFLAGHHKVFAIAGGRSCDRDEACGSPEACDSRERLRPGLAGCGIDVFGTSAAAGWPLAVVAVRGEPYHRYALILVD
jgi:predicted metal-binding protein